MISMFIASYSIPFYEIGYQTENGFVAVEDGVLPVIIDGMVILEGITLLVFQEDAGYVAFGKGIMIAVGCQITAVQRLEIMLLIVDLLEEHVAAHTLVAHLAVLHRVVVANHINVEEVLDLLQRYDGMLSEEL